MEYYTNVYIFVVQLQHSIQHPLDCIKNDIQLKCFIRWDKHRIVVDLNRFTVYILKHNNFAANHPDPVRILEVTTSHSDSTGGTVAWLLKLLVQFKIYLLQCLPGTVTISLCITSTTVSKRAGDVTSLVREGIN